MKNIRSAIVCFCCLALLTSCEEFLDAKPQKSILVPESFLEYEAILDNYSRVNVSAPLPFIYSDDFWTTESNVQRYSPWQQQAYAWNTTPYNLDEIPEDYFNLYRKVFTSNVVLDKLSENPDWTEEEKSNLLGKALFWRAHGYFELAMLFLPHPNAANVSQTQIPLRISSALGNPQGNLTSSEAFEFILNDLQNSLQYLSQTTAYPTQPSIYSGYALMARIHLYLGNYEQAIAFGEKILEGDFELMDYASLNMNPAFPVTNFNSEVVLFTTMTAISVVASNNSAFVDSLLVNSYDTTDFRRELLFLNGAGFQSFKGNYTGRPDVFTGIALDEILLLLAECNVRTGRTEEGLAFLNQLLEMRIEGYEYVGGLDQESALSLVLDHRRKSLVFRGQRWWDLKRFNALDSEVKQLRRIVGGELITFDTKPENFQVSIPTNEIN
ncbi:RagB/SusD family nutrient uptake outer membrane protein [Algoriphagus sp. NG3]|uniref:RagB/SusD family nutrient uptake outer membrane protein n=1 Tax=Algoriphagus sp. NG3 TaxID=3097546 RepID=UPI002A8193E9|nr:RagB/SusD family nutrient uptake outer membrane protein [Algoriphagus sp. NG3]WPR73742.1 RagB/SusD family nutrient uptake outer membrane protein [Algoriphagus sp. NG3]